MRNTTNELLIRFQKAGKKNADFLRWAKEHGANFPDSVVSGHLRDKRGLTESMRLVYNLFLKETEVKVEPKNNNNAFLELSQDTIVIKTTNRLAWEHDALTEAKIQE